ncbi:MAG: DUF1292 domain-containing protein [Clostridia bacterium]|nr:DUF1292 domain-containing protein [Clostridia bacterium]
MTDSDKLNNVPEDEDEITVVTLTDDDGVEKEFEVLGTLEDGGKLYYALAPADEDTDEYYLFVEGKDENGETFLSTVDDDEEFDRIADIFDDEFFSETDYDAEP